VLFTQQVNSRCQYADPSIQLTQYSSS